MCTDSCNITEAMMQTVFKKKKKTYDQTVTNIEINRVKQ